VPTIGASPSGKAADFDSAMRRFDPSRPSQSFQLQCDLQATISVGPNFGFGHRGAARCEQRNIQFVGNDVTSKLIHAMGARIPAKSNPMIRFKFTMSSTS
jgi:hypothetical protein